MFELAKVMMAYYYGLMIKSRHWEFQWAWIRKHLVVEDKALSLASDQASFFLPSHCLNCCSFTAQNPWIQESQERLRVDPWWYYEEATTKWACKMGSWLVTCTVVLAVILSTLVVGIAVTCVVHKFWKSGKLALVIPQLDRERPPPPPIILPPPIPELPPVVPEIPLPPTLFSFPDPPPRILHPFGPSKHLPGQRASNSLIHITLRAPRLSQPPDRIGKSIAPVRVNPEVFLQWQPVDGFRGLAIPAIKHVQEAAKPLLQPRHPADTEFAPVLPDRMSPHAEAPEVPFRGAQLRELIVQECFRHKGQKAQSQLQRVVPNLVPKIPTHPVMSRPTWVYQYSGDPPIYRIDIKLTRPDTPLVPRRFKELPEQTETAPVLPRPPPNPCQGGFSQLDLPLLPPDPLPQELCQRSVCQVLLARLPPMYQVPPLTVIEIFSPPDIPFEPLPPPLPRPLRDLPEWSIHKPQAPLWPRSPTPSQPLRTEQAEVLPHISKLIAPLPLPPCQTVCPPCRRQCVVIPRLAIPSPTRTVLETKLRPKSPKKACKATKAKALTPSNPWQAGQTAPGPGDYNPEHPGIHGRMPGRVPGRPEERRDPNIRL